MLLTCCRWAVWVFRSRLEIVSPDPESVSVVVLLEEHLEGLGQLERVDVRVVGEGVAEGGAGQRLQGEGVPPVDGVTQHRLEEHTGGGILTHSQRGQVKILVFSNFDIACCTINKMWKIPHLGGGPDRAFSTFKKKVVFKMHFKPF